jgi:hypothetical protein
MRKLFLLFFAVLTLQTAYAQSTIGLKFSPTLSTNRVSHTSGEGYSVSSNGVGGRFIFGPIFDLFITDNYYFSTGLLFAPKRIGITVTDPTLPTPATAQQVYNLQYLQLPANLKLFTNELALDTRVYFQLGGSLDFKISGKAQDDYDIPYIERTRLFDFSIQLGTGVEYRLGYNTILFGGFMYNRGLVNAVTRSPGELGMNVRNDLLGLDLGIKF